MGEIWPSLLTDDQKQKVDDELQRLITALGMKTCAYNIEVILDKEDTPYILELGPRNGERISTIDPVCNRRGFDRLYDQRSFGRTM